MTRLQLPQSSYRLHQQALGIDHWYPQACNPKPKVPSFPGCCQQCPCHGVGWSGTHFPNTYTISHQHCHSRCWSCISLHFVSIILLGVLQHVWISIHVLKHTHTYMGSCNHDTSCCILLLDSIWLHPMLNKRYSLVIGYTYHHGSMNIVVIIPNTETKGNESCSCQSSKVLGMMTMIMTNNNTTWFGILNVIEHVFGKTLLSYSMIPFIHDSHASSLPEMLATLSNHSF